MQAATRGRHSGGFHCGIVTSQPQQLIRRAMPHPRPHADTVHTHTTRTASPQRHGQDTRCATATTTATAMATATCTATGGFAASVGSQTGVLRSPRGHAGARAGRRVDPITSATPTPTIAATTPRRGNDAHEPTASATGDHHGQKWENIKMRPRDATPTPPCLQPDPHTPTAKVKYKSYEQRVAHIEQHARQRGHADSGTRGNMATRSPRAAPGERRNTLQPAQRKRTSQHMRHNINNIRMARHRGGRRGQAGAKGTQRGSKECARRYVCDAWPGRAGSHKRQAVTPRHATRVPNHTLR